jgi:hypothetical protein
MEKTSATKRSRSNFTAEEDDAIWRFVNVESTRDPVTNIRMWRLLQPRMPTRTAFSLKQRYLRCLWPSMERELQGREPPVVWEGGRVVNLATVGAELPAKRARREVKREKEAEEEEEEEEEGQDEEDEDAAALAAMAADGGEENDESESGLTRGTVRRWLRNLPVFDEPLVACLAARDGGATVWDGAEGTEVETWPGAVLEAGRVYRVTRSTSDRREGQRVVRVLEAQAAEGAVDAEALLERMRGDKKKKDTPAKKATPAKNGTSAKKETPGKKETPKKRRKMSDKGKEEEEEEDEEDEQEEQEEDKEEEQEKKESVIAMTPAGLVAEELARATHCTPLLALHALYVCSGVPADAHDYLSSADSAVLPWTPGEDAALRDTAQSPLQLRLDPRLAARSEAETLRRKRFLGLAP